VKNGVVERTFFYELDEVVSVLWSLVVKNYLYITQIGMDQYLGLLFFSFVSSVFSSHYGGK
jgi:hypothetical protein